MYLRLGNEESLFQAGLSGTLQSRGYDAPKRLRLVMRRIPSLFEVTLSATLSIVGLYLLHEGNSNKSPVEAILIGGAFCLTMGVMTLVSAGRSILWHRRMLRRSIPKDYLDGVAPGHNSGQ